MKNQIRIFFSLPPVSPHPIHIDIDTQFIQGILDGKTFFLPPLHMHIIHKSELLFHKICIYVFKLLYAERSYHEHAERIYIRISWSFGMLGVYGNVVNRLKYGKSVANAIGFFFVCFLFSLTLWELLTEVTIWKMCVRIYETRFKWIFCSLSTIFARSSRWVNGQPGKQLKQCGMNATERYAHNMAYLLTKVVESSNENFM